MVLWLVSDLLHGDDDPHIPRPQPGHLHFAQNPPFKRLRTSNFPGQNDRSWKLPRNRAVCLHQNSKNFAFPVAPLYAHLSPRRWFFDGAYKSSWGLDEGVAQFVQIRRDTQNQLRWSLWIPQSGIEWHKMDSIFRTNLRSLNEIMPVTFKQFFPEDLDIFGKVEARLRWWTLESFEKDIQKKSRYL